MVLPANSGSISTVAVVHGLRAFFITTKNEGALTVDLLSNRVRKVCGNSHINYFVPYTSTPGTNTALITFDLQIVMTSVFHLVT
jgi:hypothetical protein